MTRPPAPGGEARALAAKSSVEEIRARFDADVERFSNLATGQTATIDGALALELVAEVAGAVVPGARRLLDVGCGAGNQTLAVLGRLPGLACDLVDLSAPMLERASQRVSAATPAPVHATQGDVRTVPLAPRAYDVIVAGATLHHLRGDDDWRHVFARLFAATAPGGALLVTDLVSSEHPAVAKLQLDRWAGYLEALGGSAYRDQVLAYTEREDSPRSVPYQLELLRRVGYASVDVLHAHACFATYVAVRAA